MEQKYRKIKLKMALGTPFTNKEWVDIEQLVGMDLMTGSDLRNLVLILLKKKKKGSF